MPKKIYIGRLPQDFVDQSLHDLFSPLGRVVTARVVKNSGVESASSHGYVEMATDEETKKAIRGLHNAKVQESRVIVMEAHFLDQERRPTQTTWKKHRR